MSASSPGSPARLDTKGEDSLASVARCIAPGTEVLELGPGPGTLTRHLTSELGCRVDAIERSSELASTTRPWARDVWEADLDGADIATLTAGRKYDAIVATDVLEHLEDPGAVLSQSRERLRPGGEVLLSLPNVGYAGVVLELLDGHFRYRDFGILDRTHRWFFTRENVLGLVRDAGLRAERIDTIVRMPETSEFGRRLDQLADPLRDEILQNPDALAYQFIVRAVPGTMTEVECEALLRPGPPPELRFRAKLYWSTPGESSEETQHVAAFGTLGPERQRLHFALPDDPAIGTLRLDPAEGPGYVHLHSVEVTTTAGVALRLSTPDEIASATSSSGMTRIGQEGGRWLMTTDDPFLVIPLREPLPPGPERRVLVELGWPTSRDYALAQEKIDQLVLEKRELERRLAEDVASLQSRLEAARCDFDEARAHAHALQGLLDEIQQSKGWRALEWIRSLRPDRR